MAQLPLIDLASEGITYKVDKDARGSESPVEQNFGGLQVATATRRFMVTPWYKRHIFIRWLLGEVADNAPILSRTPPQRHPLYNSLFADRVTSVRGFKPAPTQNASAPVDDAGTRTYGITEYAQDGTEGTGLHKLAEYESAIIDVEYQHYRYRPWGDGEFEEENESEDEFKRYTERMDAEGTAEFLQLPGMVLKFTQPDAERNKAHGVAIPYGAGKIFPGQEFTMVWRRVPYEVYQDGDIDGTERSDLHVRIFGDPYAEEPIKPYLGTINRFPLFGYPAFTLLFERMREVRRPGPIPTTWEWDLYYTFRYNPFRWDWLYFYDTKKEIVGPVTPSASGFNLVTERGTYPETATHPAYGDYLDIQDEDSLYNTRAHQNLWVTWALDEDKD